MLKKIKAIDKKAQKEIKEKFGKKGVRLYKDVRDNTIQPKTAKNIFRSFTSGIKEQKQISGLKRVRTTYRDFTIATMNGICCCMKLYLWSEEDLQWLEGRMKTKAAEILTLINSGKMDAMDAIIGEQFIINSMITAAGLTTTEQKVYENFSHDEPIDLFIERKKLQMEHVEVEFVVEEEKEEHEESINEFEAKRKERSLIVAKKFADTNFGERWKESCTLLSRILTSIECGDYDYDDDDEFYDFISISIKNLRKILIYDIEKISKVTDINTDINTPQGHATMALINKYMSVHAGNHLFKTIIYHTGEMFLVVYDDEQGLINDVMPLHIYDDETCDADNTTSVRIKRAQFLNRIVEDTKQQMVGYDAPLTLLESLHKETRDKLDDKEFDCLSDKEFYRIVNEDVIAKATSCFEEALRLRRERKDDTTGTITEETKEVVGDILDDTEKVIETVCDGLDKVSDTIQKAIDMVKPPVEEVYEETFDDGKYPAKSAKKKNKKEREEGK